MASSRLKKATLPTTLEVVEGCSSIGYVSPSVTDAERLEVVLDNPSFSYARRS
jgi:hypothetical protein